MFANELRVVVDEENDVVQFPDQMLDLFLLKISPTVLNIHYAGIDHAEYREKTLQVLFPEPSKSTGTRCDG